MDLSIKVTNNPFCIDKSELRYTFTFNEQINTINIVAFSNVTKETYVATVADDLVFDKNDRYIMKLRPKTVFGLLYQYSQPTGIDPALHITITLLDKPKMDDVFINFTKTSELESDIQNSADIIFTRKPITDTERNAIYLKEHTEKITDLEARCNESDEAMLNLTNLIVHISTKLEKIENGSNIYVHTDRIEKLEEAIAKNQMCTMQDVEDALDNIASKEEVTEIINTIVDEKVKKYKNELVSATIATFFGPSPVTQETLVPIRDRLKTLENQQVYSKKEIDDKFSLLYQSISKATTS